MPELFYCMKYAKTDNSYYDRNLVPRTQVEIVKAVSEYIARNLSDKITVKQLTMKFGISDTYLQNAFRSVYGMPVISFIRVQKMQSAAQVLIHTNLTIDEIAEEFGYENESKFSAAFKRIMGDSPGVYQSMPCLQTFSHVLML
jgi:AraC-like DNA-binding protein